MNYIESELQRQRIFLSRLLLGVPAEGEVAAREETPFGDRDVLRETREGGLLSEASLPAEDGADPASSGAVRAAAGQREAALRLAELSRQAQAEQRTAMRTAEAQTSVALAAGEEASSSPSAGGGSKQTDSPSTAAAGRASAYGRGSGGQATVPANLPGGAFRDERGVLPILSRGDTPAGETASARTVSLWVERDARRYDGGYSMY